MNAKEHLKFSLYSVALIQAGLEVDLTLDYEQLGYVVMGSLVGSLLPDIDHRKARAGRVIPFWLLSRLFKKSYLLKHGGITHTLLVNGLIFCGGYEISVEWLQWLVYGIGFGYFTHLYADHITGNKLPMLYWPFGRRKKRGLSNKRKAKNRKSNCKAKR